MKQKWLVSYDLFINNNWGTSRRRTTIIDIEPSLWFQGELWRQGEDTEWTGIIIEMIYKIPALEPDPAVADSVTAYDRNKEE